MFLRAAIALGLGVQVSACGLDLDAEGEGKSCSADGRCADGYVCNTQSLCVKSHGVPDAQGGAGGAGGSAGSGATGGSGGSGGSANDASGGSGGTLVDAGDAGCPSPTQYFPDGDGDGFGSDEGAVLACEPPSGTWVTVGGDCADDAAQAFPGQTAYFGTPFTKGANDSFDYNCSGAEEPDGAQPDAAPDCPSKPALACNGSGYQQTGRTGAGVDPLCGSATLVVCSVSGLSCSFDTESTEPKRCN
jgi:hypothetical protein